MREADILWAYYYATLPNCSQSIACRTLGHGRPLEFSQPIPVWPIRGYLRTLGSSRRGTRYTDTPAKKARRVGSSRGSVPLEHLTQTPPWEHRGNAKRQLAASHPHRPSMYSPGTSRYLQSQADGSTSKKDMHKEDRGNGCGVSR